MNQIQVRTRGRGPKILRTSYLEAALTFNGGKSADETCSNLQPKLHPKEERERERERSSFQCNNNREKDARARARADGATEGGTDDILELNGGAASAETAPAAARISRDLRPREKQKQLQQAEEEDGGGGDDHDDES